MRRFATIPSLLCFFVLSTGAVRGLHLQTAAEADSRCLEHRSHERPSPSDDHRSDQCPVCYLLTCCSKAAVDFGDFPPLDAHELRLGSPQPDEDLKGSDVESPFGPRGPPSR